MKKKILLFSLLLTMQQSVQAQMSESELRVMTEYSTPGEMHQFLARQDGIWRERVSFWSAPGAEPIKYIAFAENTMIMEGRFQYSTHRGDMNGMPFEGVSITGYDNARKVFVNTWFDNSGTGIMLLEGKWNEQNKSIEFKGDATDPSTKKQIPVREVLTIIDDSHKKLEIYSQHKGREFKSMEIDFTRQ